MFLKKKHIIVIILSSMIVASVFLSTLVGYNLYIQWKKDTFAMRYRDSIYKLTAELFRNDIIISNVSVKSVSDKMFAEMPELEGSLKNNSSKTITSILIEVSFLRPDRTVVYKDWFYLLGDEHFDSFALAPRMTKTRNILLPGEGISFRYLLRNCPREIVSQVSAKSNFAKSHSRDKIALVYSVQGLSVL